MYFRQSFKCQQLPECKILQQSRNLEEVENGSLFHIFFVKSHFKIESMKIPKMAS